MAQFCVITGADEASATHFLEASGGDVDMAVGLFIDSDGKPASGPAQSAVVEDDVRKPIAPSRGVLIDEDVDYGAERSHWVDPRQSFATRRPTTAPFSSFTDRVDLTTERGRRLAELFRIPQEITHTGTFDSGKKEAKTQQRYLIVSLHDGSEFVCQMLNRDLWNQDSVQEFVSNNLIFMQLNTATEDGERYMRLYTVTGHPHIGLLDPRTGRLVKSWSSVPSPVDFIGDVLEFIERNPLGTRKNEENATCVGLNSPSQGDIKEDPAPSPQGETKAPVIAAMPEEPAPDCPDATTVQFQLPDGKRIRRRFSLTDPISTLLVYVSAFLQVPSESFEVLEHSRSVRDLPQDTSIGAAGIRNSALKVITRGDVA